MLTEAQLKAREGKLTASRVKCLMTGDAAEILRLYNEMIGEELPDDLRHVWPVRLGEATEELQLNWYEEKNGPVSLRGKVVTHETFSWAACTLDGWDVALRCPIECKHVGGREPLEVIIDRYQPQMQWQMMVTGADQCALSVIMGADAPVVEFVECAPDYIAEMVKRAQQFMECLAARRPPVALEPAPPPADASKIYDMQGNNLWGSLAAVWVETKPYEVRCVDAAKGLKAMVPEDAKKVHGHSIQITRDRAGRLSLREITK